MRHLSVVLVCSLVSLTFSGLFGCSTVKATTDHANKKNASTMRSQFANLRVIYSADEDIYFYPNSRCANKKDPDKGSVLDFANQSIDDFSGRTLNKGKVKQLNLPAKPAISKNQRIAEFQMPAIDYFYISASHSHRAGGRLTMCPATHFLVKFTANTDYELSYATPKTSCKFVLNEITAQGMRRNFSSIKQIDRSACD